MLGNFSIPFEAFLEQSPTTELFAQGEATIAVIDFLRDFCRRGCPERRSERVPDRHRGTETYSGVPLSEAAKAGGTPGDGNSVATRRRVDVSMKQI